MKRIVTAFGGKPDTFESFLPQKLMNIDRPIVDQNLYYQQIAISNILESSINLSEAKHKLSKSTLTNSAWNVENWDDDMLDTAIQIAQKWK